MEFSLQEELSALANGNYDFPNQLDTMDPAEVNMALNGTPPVLPVEWQLMSGKQASWTPSPAMPRQSRRQRSLTPSEIGRASCRERVS